MECQRIPSFSLGDLTGLNSQSTDFNTFEKRKVNEARQKIIKMVQSKIFSIKEFQEYALYDPEFGYYSRNVKIGSSKTTESEVDFITKPMLYSVQNGFFPSYGGIWGEVVFDLWENMLELGVLKKGEEFNVFEFGGGLGVLAHDFLLHSRKMSELGRKNWEQFYHSLRYIIGEISPYLRKKQQEKLSFFRDKVQILDIDVRKMNRKGEKGIVISNELPDAFPVHLIKKRLNGDIQVGFCIPLLLEPECLQLSQEQKRQIRDDHSFLKTCFDHAELSSQMISKQTYARLRKKCNDQLKVGWKKAWLPIQNITQAKEFIERHHDFCKNLVPEQEYTLNIDLTKFQETTSSLILDGYKITIDYQYGIDKIPRFQEPFRCYPKKYPSPFSANPGTMDITSDVNATFLAEEGARVGWKNIWYGNEGNLLEKYVVRAVEWNDREGDRFVKRHKIVGYHKLFFNVLIEKKASTPSTIAFEGSEPVTYKEIFHSNLKLPFSLISQHLFTITPITSKLGRALYQYAKTLPQNYLPKEQDMTEHSWKILEPEGLHKGVSMIYYRKVIDKMMDLFGYLFSEGGLLEIANKYPSMEAFDFQSIKHFFSFTEKTYQPDVHSDMIIRFFLDHYYRNRTKNPNLGIVKK